MSRIDWAGLLRRALAPQALGGLGVTPAEFWALSPIELRLMLGVEALPPPVGRAALQALMARFPDQGGMGDGGSRDDCRGDGPAGEQPGWRGAGGGGL